MSSLAFDGLLRKSSVRDERTVGRDVELAVGLRVRSAHTIIQSLSAVEYCKLHGQISSQQGG